MINEIIRVIFKGLRNEFHYLTGDHDVSVRQQGVDLIEALREEDISRAVQDFILPAAR
jgi:hypothetical protein